MNLIRFFVFIVLVCVLNACGGGESTEKLNPDSVILAYGDSLTRGKGTTLDSSYPAVLSELTSLKVVNEGISGELSDAGLRRLPGVLESVKPDFMILMHGGNDILRNQSKTKLKANLNEMINLAKQAKVDVLLVCLPEKTLFSSCSSLYRELSDENSVLLESGIIAKLLKTPSMKSDRVHFNQAGYKAIAEKFATVLSDAGLL